MTHRQRLSQRRGFTFVELAIVLLLTAVIASSLYRVLVWQHQFYRDQQATSARFDALRLGSRVLESALIEANASEGDFIAIGSDSVRVRSPVGFAIVCAADTASNTIGLINTTGLISSQPGDSVLIYRPSGWLVRKVVALDPATPVLACPYSSGPTVQLKVRLDGSVADVPIGAPLRSFHVYTYRLDEDRNSWWLARDDGSASEILAGPFEGDSSGLSFAYLDTLEQATSNPALVARVDLILAAATRVSTDVDTLDLSVGVRNR